MQTSAFDSIFLINQKAKIVDGQNRSALFLRSQFEIRRMKNVHLSHPGLDGGISYRSPEKIQKLIGKTDEFAFEIDVFDLRYG
jgi:hypothetical protein